MARTKETSMSSGKIIMEIDGEKWVKTYAKPDGKAGDDDSQSEVDVKSDADKADGEKSDQADKSTEEKSDSADKAGDDEKDDDKPEPEGMKCGLKHFYEGYQQCTCCINWQDTKPDKMEDPDSEGKSASYAVVVRIQVNHDNGGTGRKTKVHSIVVQSPLLKTVLKKVFEGYPGLTFKSKQLSFASPFQPFVHRWDELKAAVEGEKDPETKKHLELLRKMLEEELKDALESARVFAEHKVIDFAQLWTIFRPGGLVYSRQGKTDCAFKLKKTQAYYSKETSTKYLLCHCYLVDWDGERFGVANEVLAIPQYEGSIGLSELIAYPMEHHPEQEALLKKLEARGRIFQELAGIRYKHYHGIGIDDTQQEPKTYSVDGRVVIDAAGFVRSNPSKDPRLGPLSDIDNITMNADADHTASSTPYLYDNYGHPMRNNGSRLILSPAGDDPYGQAQIVNLPSVESHLNIDQFVICRHKVRAFSLEIKTWVHLEIEGLTEIAWNHAAFENLVLPGDYKNLLLAFAQTQRASGEKFDDLIKGKGKGMIMLLHGPPGVGKTLTAESVAEVMQVPIYSISSGELGLDSHSVEVRLNEVFKMVRSWNAVLLLDEADIFMERRTMDNLKRNGLVSVFLQTLEYYQGILFLTTNRVETFDPAFESRLHISITYPELAPSSRRQVWKNFLKRVPIGSSDIVDKDLDFIAELRLNGRQIKNAVKTAGLLAAKAQVPLRMEHLKTVLRIMKCIDEENVSNVPPAFY